jgi:long-chain acyl-CoA synthetase
MQHACFTTQVYSNVRNFKTDLVKYKPHYLIAVPRLFETIYKGAQTNFAAQPASKQKLVAIFSAVSTLYMRLARVRAGMVVRSKVLNGHLHLVEHTYASIQL